MKKKNVKLNEYEKSKLGFSDSSVYLLQVIRKSKISSHSRWRVFIQNYFGKTDAMNFRQTHKLLFVIQAALFFEIFLDLSNQLYQINFKRGVVLLRRQVALLFELSNQLYAYLRRLIKFFIYPLQIQ